MGEEKSDTEGGRTEDHEDEEDAKPTAEEGEGRGGEVSPLWPRGSGGQEKRVGRGEAEGLSSRRRLEIARSLVVSSAAHANIGRGLSGLHFSWHASARSNPNLSPTPPLAAAPSEFLLDLSNDPAKRFSGFYLTGGKSGSRMLRSCGSRSWWKILTETLWICIECVRFGGVPEVFRPYHSHFFSLGLSGRKL